MIKTPGKKLNTEIFINRAIDCHGVLYDYSKSIYVNDKTKIEIICKYHGSFWQTSNAHFRNQGCPACGRDKTIKSHTKNTENFIAKANKIHNNKYDYSLTTYITRRTEVEIICPIHGLFLQTPNTHLQNKGCPSCSKNISHKEIKWLDNLGISKDFRHKVIKIGNTIIRVDAIDLDKKNIYEFYGDYWHGNPEKYPREQINKSNFITFGELYDKTLLRESFLIAAGYKIISIWESEFDEK